MTPSPSDLPTHFGNWEIVSLPFMGEPTGKYNYRAKMVRVRCMKCGYERAHKVSMLKSGASRGCAKCQPAASKRMGWGSNRARRVEAP